MCRALALRLRHALVHDAVLAASLVGSLVAIVVYRRAPQRAVQRPLPPYPGAGVAPDADARAGRSATSTPSPAARPRRQWLTVPQRGLYTGIMILGAVGTGKTSACMYPYVDQLLRWRAPMTRRGRSAAWCWR